VKASRHRGDVSGLENARIRKEQNIIATAPSGYVPNGAELCVGSGRRLLAELIIVVWYPNEVSAIVFVATSIHWPPSPLYRERRKLSRSGPKHLGLFAEKTERSDASLSKNSASPGGKPSSMANSQTLDKAFMFSKRSFEFILGSKGHSRGPTRLGGRAMVKHRKPKDADTS